MDVIDTLIKSDRRTGKMRGNLLKYLSDSMSMIYEAWNTFSKINVKNQIFLEELSGILIAVNSIKELCHNKGIFFLSNQADELEIALNELFEFPEVGDALLYQAILLKMNDLSANIEVLLKEYQNASTHTDIKQLDDIIAISPPVINKRIFIISNDNSFIAECSGQISHYGYCAFSFNNFDDFLTSLTQGLPIAIIADLDLFIDSNGNKSQYSLEDYHNRSSSIPMLVVSTQTDFQARFQSVKAGSIGFFGKPVNVSSLLDKLDSVIYSFAFSEPPKVLVIDDSKTISQFLYKTLTNVGMDVKVETTPEAALSMIGKFNPELILMDMYMPLCDGEDLCRIIRQYESFTSIPIVFLSSETDVKKQLNAMKIGADDFLTKEIDPQHLITSITTRIQRHRILTSFMIRDSLTGLLNHTTSKKQLEQMIEKASSLLVPITFAMVDIDKFKKVNDTYGHPTGDKVIKSLSRLLQKRLRKTDSIGRYGGEEFAIVFWDTNAENAKKILDKIREDFSKIEHTSGDITFFTTFSAGLADYPNYTDGASMSNAADRALYASKENGRNQITLANND